MGKVIATEKFVHDDKIHGKIDASFSGGVIVDWKTCKKDDRDDGKVKLPFDLKNSSHSRNCLQMNLYRRMIEGRQQVNKMFTVYLEVKDRTVEVERIENLDKIINFVN